MSDRIQEAAEVLAGVTNRGMRRPGSVGDGMLARGKDLPLVTAEDYMEEAQALADAGLLASREHDAEVWIQGAREGYKLYAEAWRYVAIRNPHQEVPDE